MILQETLFNKNIKSIKKNDLLNRWSDSKTWTSTLYFEADSKQYEIVVKRAGAQTKIQLVEDGTDISDHKVLDTYKDWFKVEDHSGSIGWIKKTLISSSRWAFIKNDLQPLKIKPSLPSKNIMIAEYGVLGKILICKIDWCKLNIENKSGWINKVHLWGVHPGEKIK